MFRTVWQGNEMQEEIERRRARAAEDLARLREASDRRHPPGGKATARTRFRERLERQFVGRPIKEKLVFLRLSLIWIARNVVRRGLRKVAPAKRAPVPPPTGDRARLAFHVPGAIGDLVNASVFFAELARLNDTSIDVFYKNPSVAQTVYYGAEWLGRVLNAEELEGRVAAYDVVG